MSLVSQTDQDDFVFLDEPDGVKKPFWVRHSTILLLIAIMLGAAFFRFIGRDFDQGHNQHPDERAIIGRTLSVGWPSSFDQFLDPRTSPLNLRSNIAEGNCPNGCEYPWGSLPVYLTKAGGWLLDTLLPPTDQHPRGYYLRDYQGTQTVGRTLASIFDLITVLLVFLIARRLYSKGTALIATALVAFAVTEFQIAHYYISEPFLVCFMVGALYFSVVLMQSPRWWAAAGAGACLGFAVASKVTIAFFGLIIIAAIVLRAAYRTKSRKLGADLDDPVGMSPATATERSRSFGGHLVRGLRYFLIAALFTLIAFSISEPYALRQFDFTPLQTPAPGATFNDSLKAVMDSNPWTRRIGGEAAIQSGESDIPYTRQYIGTIPVLYHGEQLVLWGMGVLPGLVGLAGIVLAVYLAFRRRPAEILLLAGAIPYFLTIVNLESKWMRYMLPLVPIVAILAAALLVRGTAWARARYADIPARLGRGPAYGVRQLQRNFFPIVTALTVAFALLWSVAFSNIYTQDHSRVQASAWIYDNVPNGSHISSEGWDDALPLGLQTRPGEEGRDGGTRGYQNVQFNLYDDRAPEEELAYLSDLFRQTDYVVLASNRLYGSIPRLPWRYPIQTKYYQLLYAEKLGYVRVHTAQVTPELFGLQINDQLADESFTVYDHPRVDIFKKVTALTDDQLRSLFATDLDRPLGQYSAQRHGSVFDDKSLMLDQPLPQVQQLGDYAWNPLAQEETQWIGVLLWLVAVYLLGFAAMPLVFTICRRLPDKGYPLAKLIGLLLVSWGVWILASAKLVPFTVWSIAFTLLLLAGLGLLSWKLGAGSEIRGFMRSKRRLVIFYEGIFLAAFAAFLVVRMLNPDLWHPFEGGEKPMEFGFLNAILRSPWMPPADPFFAGGYINYYYQGQFIIACLIKLIGVDPAIGFNLAIPLLYAFTFSGAACIVYNVVAWSQRRRGSVGTVSRAGMGFAVLGGVLAIVIGNLYALLQFVTVNFPQSTGPILDWGRGMGIITDGFKTNFDFWSASRIIPGTINEFPFWSFLFADLHPHLIDMPFTLLVAAFAMNLAFAGRFAPLAPGGHRSAWYSTLLRRVRSSLAWLWGPGWSGAMNFAVMAVALGALFAINTWDFPTYLGLAAGAVLIALLLSRTKPAVAAVDAPAIVEGADHTLETEEHSIGAPGAWTLLGAGVLSVAAVALVSLLAYLPFFLNFKAFFTKLMPLVDGGTIENTGAVMKRTTLGEYTVVWAIFLFIAVSYLVYRLWNFPWRAAFADLARRMPGGQGQTSTTSLSPSQTAAFSVEQTAPHRRLRRLDLAPSFSTPGSAPVTQMAFASHHGDNDSAGRASLTDPRPSDQSPDIEVDAFGTGEDSLIGANDSDGLFGRTGTPGETPEASASERGTATEEHVPAGDEIMITHGASEVGSEAGGLFGTTNWVADAHSEAGRQGQVRYTVEQPGVIPLWAGLSLLVVAAGVVILQLVTDQWLLALLVALIGGLTATLLSTSRSVSALFGGLLLVTALLVSVGVELVYLADHLSGGDTYRMNTVFKFYIQVWLLFALGGAVAVYYIIYGLKERVAARQVSQDKALELVHREPGNLSDHVDEGHAGSLEQGYSDGSSNGHLDLQPQYDNQSAAPGNWLVWSADNMDTDPQSQVVERDLEAPQQDSAEIDQPDSWVDMPALVAHTVAVASEPDLEKRTRPRWTLPRIAWSALFALFMLASLIYTVYGTRDRVGTRFSNPPSIGTLSGTRYMNSAQFGAVVPTNAGEVPVPVNLKYDYEAINWLNKHVQGLTTIAELPLEYYRADGMRVAANTGLPMVVGGLHQDEQRADVYARLVGSRRGEMNDFFATNDVQRALTLISKYDIKYIYLGQVEQAAAGEAGMKKFEQMAGANVGILSEVFRSDSPSGAAGTIIYEVSGAKDKDPKTLVGVPVANSGIPGISITPLPTSTPIPPPTPPVDNPVLKALIADLAASPNDREKRLKLSDWYRDNGYPLEAAQELSILTKQDPTNVALWSQLGDLYTAAHQPDKALRAWEDGRDASPDNPDAHNKVGVAYFQLKRFDDAQREFQAAVNAAPTFVESWFHLGEVNERKGDLEGAKRAYKGAIDNSKEANSWKDAAQQRLSQIK